jgi:predicted enzyme related to lactoylglutathione lyase
VKLAHITLPTRDVERTAAFLEHAFEWPRARVPDNSPVDVVWFDIGANQQLHVFYVEGFEVSAFEHEFGRHIALYHHGGDLDALKRRLTAAGATLITPRRATSYERVFFREPVNSYVFEIILPIHFDQ